MYFGKTPKQLVKNRWKWGIAIKTKKKLGQVMGHNSHEHSLHSTCTAGWEISAGGITAAATHRAADVAEKPGLDTPRTGAGADVLIQNQKPPLQCVMKPPHEYLPSSWYKTVKLQSVFKDTKPSRIDSNDNHRILQTFPAVTQKWYWQNIYWTKPDILPWPIFTVIINKSGLQNIIRKPL